MRIRLKELLAALDADHIDGAVCATPGCTEPVRQRGARCLEHRGAWDRERRRLAERERRRRAHPGGEGNVTPPGAGFETIVEVPRGSPRNTHQSSKAAGTGPIVVVGLDPGTGPSIPPVETLARSPDLSRRASAPTPISARVAECNRP